MSHEHQTRLQIGLQLQKLLDERGIRQETLQQVISSAETNHRFFTDPVTRHQLAYRNLPQVTYWVEYQKDVQSYTIFSAYSHRMKILEGFELPPRQTANPLAWRCAACEAALEMATVKLFCLEETFGVDLPACPSCQRVLISEKNAVQKMALAEKMFEDK